ncbi:TIR domain-containing protein [Evansella halocellulosilytica]|uniref:TIR domain-containing protein n=1 Tax=Evansella halocellulosilytica TaxID=2011013 RepID=UPI000BB942D3|nr:nucleotide-binding protein [Evansella halocellulosilytica]
MKQSVNNTVFQLKKVIRDINNYNKEWRYIDAFERYVLILNNCSKRLELPIFEFESFHYSNTGKTINDVGYDSLITHISILEEMLPNVFAIKEQKPQNEKNQQDSKKVFIVHGRDKTALLETEGILNRVGLKPIVLNRMANSGLTLIEKFEKYSEVSYAIVLLTPDDIGALYENAPIESLNHKFRARQNVLFELGFFYGKLGRSKVCCILKSSVEKPTDIDGIAYIPYNQSVEEAEYALLKELKGANLEFHLYNV